MTTSIDRYPLAFWATIMVGMGNMLLIVVLIKHVDATISNGIVQVANTLISGAVGALGSHMITNGKEGAKNLIKTEAGVSIDQSGTSAEGK